MNQNTFFVKIKVTEISSLIETTTQILSMKIFLLFIFNSKKMVSRKQTQKVT